MEKFLKDLSNEEIMSVLNKLEEDFVVDITLEKRTKNKIYLSIINTMVGVERYYNYDIKNKKVKDLYNYLYNWLFKEIFNIIMYLNNIDEGIYNSKEGEN